MLLKEVKDAEGQMVCVNTLIEGVKVILCNIYVPNKGDPHFFHGINKVLGDMDGQEILFSPFSPHPHDHEHEPLNEGIP